MYELDDGKDQVMTVLKLALANLAMYVRDRYFPPEYARATWRRLASFLCLPGRVVWRADTVTVELQTFNDRGLNRDLVMLQDRVRETAPRLPHGRLLLCVGDIALTVPELRDRCVA